MYIFGVARKDLYILCAINLFLNYTNFDTYVHWTHQRANFPLGIPESYQACIYSMYIGRPSSKYAQTSTNGEQLNNKTFKPKQINKMYFRYVRTIQNQNPVQSSNSLPRKNKVKKASHEKKQVRLY